MLNGVFSPSVALRLPHVNHSVIHIKHQTAEIVAEQSKRVATCCMPCTCRAQQQYMHEVSADRDHAMHNIQISTIPVVRLKNLQKLSNIAFEGTGVLNSVASVSVFQCNAKCFRTKWQHRQWRCLAERVSFSGSCVLGTHGLSTCVMHAY
jgi:hypothetical protein